MKTNKRTLLLLLSSLMFVSCGTIEGEYNNSSVTHIDTSISNGETSINSGDSSNNSATSSNNDGNTEQVDVTLTVKLFRGSTENPYVPTTDINVVFYNDYAKYLSPVSQETGEAVLSGIDGTYYVALENAPSGYTCIPSTTPINGDNPYAEIILKRIYSPSKGTGEDKYTNIYQISENKTYETTFKNSGDVYYRFEPSKSGVYALESYVSLFDDLINPKLLIYTTSVTNLDDSRRITINDGGTSLKNHFTKNFYYEIKVDKEEIGNGYAFVIQAESKNGYPVKIPFGLNYIGEYSADKIKREVIYPQEIGTKSNPKMTPSSSKTFVTTNENEKLVGKHYKYNEEDGYYHVYDEETDTYKEILCAYITGKTPYLDLSIRDIQTPGNSSLTVSNGTEFYEYFIAGSYYISLFGEHADVTPSTYDGICYADVCNSDGVCYVTQELKDFLQKFAIAQRLFFDGDGVVETGSPRADATQDDQWLFACGYYKD